MAELPSDLLAAIPPGSASVAREWWDSLPEADQPQVVEHLATVVRYVERNPVRAGLASRAEHWPCSSLGGRPGGPWLDAETFIRKAD